METPLAILFVDIADSTQLYERMGNIEAAALTQKMLRHLRMVIEGKRGQVIKMLGDGLLGAFPSAEEAGWAAITMVESQAAFRLQLRVGLHFGPVVQRTEDLYGDACNVCARVEALAKPGEILATEDFVQLVSDDLRRRTKLLNNISVKGKSAPLRIHQLHTTVLPDEPSDNMTMAAVSLPEAAASRLMLHVDYKGTAFTVDAVQRRLSVGREESSALRILTRRTSRQHAVIDFSRESFILTDHSTNGTFVRTGDSLPVALKRDSTKLVGSGLIGFGEEPEHPDQDHVAAFRCDLA